MRAVAHPGPAAADRLELRSCAGRDIEVVLPPGMPLEDAVAEALAPEGLDSAWLEIAAAPVERLGYVIPALSADAGHVAWYSGIRGFGAGTIGRIGMIVGRHEGASFLHGHGLWSPRGGPRAMGHILAPRTVLARPAPARGIGLNGAMFDRLRDEETNFELFRVRGTGGVKGDHAALRLRPNQDFATAIHAACARLGWGAARVHGIGSLIGAQFEDGSLLGSLPSEFLVTDCEAGRGGPEPEILIVGIDGSTIMSGRLTRGENAVLITAELVLVRIG